MASSAEGLGEEFAFHAVESTIGARRFRHAGDNGAVRIPRVVNFRGEADFRINFGDMWQGFHLAPGVRIEGAWGSRRRGDRPFRAASKTGII